FSATATPETYTLSLHDALPICYLLEAGAAGLADSVERAHLREPWVFKKLGLAYSKLALYDPVYLIKMKYAWSRYLELGPSADDQDRKSTRLNSSHLVISYAVFC